MTLHKHWLYLSSDFIVGILSQFNLKWLISLYLAAFRYFDHSNLTLFH